MKTPEDRFVYYLQDILNKSVNVFAAEVGLSAKTIYMMINKFPADNPPSLRKIRAVYSNFPIDWIRTGEGEPTKPEIINDLKRLRDENEDLKRMIATLEGQLIQQEKNNDIWIKRWEECKKSKGLI